MYRRFFAITAGVSLFVLGCESDKSITTTPPVTALVRFVNATVSDTIDLAISGLANPVNGNIAFGGASGCLTVTAANPTLTFRRKGTTTDLTGFTPSFTAGKSYWVVAVTGASALEFVTLEQTFAPTDPKLDAGIASLNAINGGGPFDTHITLPAGTLSSTTVKNANLAFKTPSAFANDPLVFNTATPPVQQPQQLQFTNAGALTVVRNHGNVTLGVNTQNLAIIAPGAPATPTTLRSIVNGGC